MMRPRLIIFVKAPRVGRVKTRLGRETGFGRASYLFRILMNMTLAEVGKVRGVDRILAVDPPAARRASTHLWPKQFERIAQAPGDLGNRLKAALAAAPGPVVIIGADAPGLRARHLRAAFKALERSDAVFGPAEDGGFWLIGLKRRARHLFKGVRWSTRHTLADTLASLPPAFRVARLDTLRDIDEAADLSACGPLLRSRAGSR